jgi:hypothetical protein
LIAAIIAWLIRVLEMVRGLLIRVDGGRSVIVKGSLAAR